MLRALKVAVCHLVVGFEEIVLGHGIDVWLPDNLVRDASRIFCRNIALGTEQKYFCHVLLEGTGEEGARIWSLLCPVMRFGLSLLVVSF